MKKVIHFGRKIRNTIAALFMAALGFLNLYEGLDHALDAGLQIWGMTDNGIFDWRFAFPAIKAIFWTVVSIATFIKLRQQPPPSCPNCGAAIEVTAHRH